MNIVFSSQTQKKSLQHSLLASKLNKLTIPPSASSSSSPPQDHDFDFSEVFGSLPSPHPNLLSSSPSSSIFLGDPPIIHNRSHSFVGPSPRFTLSKSLPFHPEIDSDSSGEDEIEFDSERVNGEIGKLEEGKEGKQRKIGPWDFEIMRVIGKGAFGKVFQVRRKRNGIMNCDGEVEGEGIGDGIFAMKVMRKDTIIKNNHVDYMRAERDILTKVVHPFIVPLRYSFQGPCGLRSLIEESSIVRTMRVTSLLRDWDICVSAEEHLKKYCKNIEDLTKSKLYLILDFINGGHLFYHLYRQRFFSEDEARVYCAEIVSAVSHLHKNGIVHRDLKPENILMDADGHVMLTDFGLAKEIDESSRSNSMCGTTEYMAPEILLAKGHNKDADWWSVGILLYEMLTGKPPYIHANRKKLQEKIINEKVKLLPRLTTEVHSLLKGLLQKDPTKRLGSGPNGADEIKKHKWFRSINWKKLESRELPTKFKPDVNGEDCTANFDKCWTTMPLEDSPAPTPTAGEHFHGYSYVAPNPWNSPP